MKKFEDIIYIFLIILIVIAVVPKEFQNDTFFTIASGKEILENGISTEEKLVWHDNLKTINARWLFDIALAFIYDKFGYFGIYLFVIVFSAIQGGLYYFVLSKITKRKLFSFFITVISISYLQIAFTARALLLSNLFLFIEFYCLEQIKVAEQIKKRYIITLLILPILFVNVHASMFPIYLVVYLPYFAEYIISKLPLKNSEGSHFKYEVKNFTLLINLFTATIFLGFIVPSGVHPHVDMFVTYGGISTKVIAEMQELSIFENVYLATILISTIAILIFSKTKIRLTDALFILGFALMAMNTRRAVFYFILISSICFSRLLIDFLQEYEFNFNIIPDIIIKLATVFAIIMILAVSSVAFLKNYVQDYVSNEKFPIMACEYIKQNLDLDKMKIYNGFNYGSYLEFQGIKAFIDSRAEIFMRQYNLNCTVLEDFVDISSVVSDYKAIMSNYEFTHLLISITEPLCKCIQNDSNWKYIYQDNGFIIFERVGDYY